MLLPPGVCMYSRSLPLRYLHVSFEFFFSRRTSNLSPFSGRARGLRGSTRLSLIHTLHFGLADWVMAISTPAPF